ncbi:MAG: cell division protein [Gammaproteobacteria bacterium HGW-Gammaproteobacteria-14]|nr:MAG: cell division protein [Gammaproteobacteria bacterium HGW-Gammaproteobacteria-14]
MARKPASRGASRSRKPERQVAGWVWLLTGVVAGVFIAFLYHLAQVRLDPAPQTVEAKTPAPSTETDNGGSGPRFDFYAVLPKMEVILPKSEEPDLPRRVTSQQPESNDTGSTATPTRSGEQFLLQAGSFRSDDDANRRRGELILQGFSARIQPVSMGNGDTWHRVMVGPFDNANVMHRAQDKLANAGIETLAIRVKQD